MKIVIAQGDHAADYIVKTFIGRGHKLIVINSDRKSAKYLADANKIPVFVNDPTKKSSLEDAHIENSDLFISLGDEDCDNYVSCILAKKVFNVKKCICIVNNPKNVELFRELGVDSVVSATQLLASSIVAESSLENLGKIMPFEDDKIILTEIIVKPTYEIANKHIFEISFPKVGNISCIYRKPNVIIPNGSTVILPKDKLIIISTPANQKELVTFIQRESAIKDLSLNRITNIGENKED